MWRNGRGEVRLVPVGGLWVVSSVGGVLFPCLEVAACGVDGRDGLPDIGVSVSQGCRDVVEVRCLDGLVDATHQKDCETGKCGFDVAWERFPQPVKWRSLLEVVSVGAWLLAFVGVTGVC